MDRINVSAALTASGQAVGNAEAGYCGYTVLVVTAVGAINIRKTSQTGSIIDVIPSATPAGSSKLLPRGIKCEGGIAAEFVGGATGTLIVHFE
jgi:hypothetical protein